MRHNGRPTLVASKLNPADLDLREGWRPLVACPDCGCWTAVRRGMLNPHRFLDGPPGFSISDGRLVPARRRDGNPPRCLGSGQRIRLDVSPEEWQAKAVEAVRDAASRRGTRVLPKPKPAPVPAVSQIAAQREVRLSKAGHLAAMGASDEGNTVRP